MLTMLLPHLLAQQKEDLKFRFRQFVRGYIYAGGHDMRLQHHLDVILENRDPSGPTRDPHLVSR